MEPKRFSIGVWVAAALFFAPGCTHLFAREDRPAVDKIVVGATRAVVEAELGTPISEIENVQGATGMRECIYKVLVKDPAGENDSLAVRIRAGMVGFVTYQYRVLYDRKGNVVHADELQL